MTVTSMRFPKSETRDFADQDRLAMSPLAHGDSGEWQMSNGTFFTAFVAIAAVLAIAALVLR